MPFLFRRPSPRPVAPRRAPVPADEDAPTGCGWFDSSHDLQQGLQVQELQPGTDLPASAPLGWWLPWALDEWPPSVGAGGCPSR